MRRTAGMTLIEMTVTLFIALAVAGALLRVFVDTTTNQAFLTSQNDAETQARQPLDSLIDHLRNAQNVKSQDNSVIKSGTSSSVEYYGSNSATDVVKYYLDGTDLKRLYGATTTTVMTDVQELEFTYFVSAESPAQYYTETVPTQYSYVSDGELPNLTEIEVRIVVSIDGYARELKGTVRLRNSPLKRRL